MKSQPTTSPLLDSSVRYGLITRALHWSMAALFAFQFSGMAIKLVLGRHPLSALFVGLHKPLGAVLMLLILVRGLWGLSQWRRRPPHPSTFVGRAAAVGHAVLYALMLYVPLVALLREYASGRGFAMFGLELLPATGSKIAHLGALADASHGLFAWILLATVIGHIAMVGVHHVFWRDATLSKMAGKL